MKVLVDTNVLLDVLLEREPFCQPATDLLAAVERRNVVGYLAAHAVPHVFQLVKKKVGGSLARKEIQKLIFLLDVAPVHRAVVEAALRSNVADFEDAIVDEAAALIGADVIATRNINDFRKSKVMAQSPQAIVAMIRVAK